MARPRETDSLLASSGGGGDDDDGQGLGGRRLFSFHRSASTFVCATIGVLLIVALFQCSFVVPPGKHALVSV